MPMYWTCPNCGSNNNPGERCDCYKLTILLLAKEAGCPITDEELDEAIPPAIEKLHRIIQRECDADGDRLKQDYLQLLIMEQIMQLRFSQFTQSRYKEKRNAAKASVPI